MNESDTRAAAVPVAAGLFEQDGESVHLLGSLCRGCGRQYFPRTPDCRNPACVRKELDPIRLPRRGTLYSYTVQAYRPPAPFRRDDWAPYAIGLVDLPGGLRVMGIVGDCALDDIYIGMDLEVGACPLYHDASGHQVLTYRFSPPRPGGPGAQAAQR